MGSASAFAAFLSEAGIDTLRDEPMGPHTTLKIGGPADFLVRPADEEQLERVLARARECDVGVRILGSGANLLVDDAGWRGAVVQLKHFNRRDGLHVQAGYNLAQLVRESVDEGRAGLECLAGVPASVGGAIAMNAGGRHGDLAGAVVYVDAVTPEGKLRRFRKEEVGFRYRSWGLARHVAVAAGFRLRPDPEARSRYDLILGEKKATQPLGTHNAGCIFKNPSGHHAGRLIDSAGLKGAREGRAVVSTKHANFIVNEGGATSAEVRRLIDRIRAQVRDRFSVDLELEILQW